MRPSVGRFLGGFVLIISRPGYLTCTDPMQHKLINQGACGRHLVEQYSDDNDTCMAKLRMPH